MRKVAAAVLLLVATSAWGYRARPVSDLRFDSRSDGELLFVAGDGRESLVLSEPHLYTERRRVLTQKIVDGRPVGAVWEIASGRPAGLVWTGSEYLAAWTSDDVLWVGRVSRDGSLVSAPVQLPASTPASPLTQSALLASGRSVLALARRQNGITAYPLDLAGRPAGAPVTHALPEWVRASEAAAGKFAVIFSDGTLMLLRADGTADHAAPIAIDRAVIEAAIATDGTETLVAYLVGSPNRETKSVLLTAKGTIRSVQMIHRPYYTHSPSLQPRAAVWDSSRWVVAVGNTQAFTLGRNGEVTGGPVQLVNADPVALLRHGRDLLMLVRAGGGLDAHSVIVNPATLTAGTPLALGRTLNAQQQLTVEAGNSGYLAVWFELGATTTIRASRLDRAGNYLDGAGIVLDVVSNVPRPPGPVTAFSGPFGPTIAIDGDGPQWFVVWSDGVEVRARGVSYDGATTTEPIPIGRGHAAAVRWDGSQYVVLRSDNSVHRDLVTAGGAVTGTKKVVASFGGSPSSNTAYKRPALARLGNEVLGIYVEVETNCYITIPVICLKDVTVYGVRLDVPDALPFVIGQSSRGGGEVAVASSPERVLVTWSRWSQQSEIVAAFLSAAAPDHPEAPFSIDAPALGPSVAFDGTNFAAAWMKGAYGETTGLATARITGEGVVADRTEMRLDDGEGFEAPAIASSSSVPPLFGYVQMHSAYGSVPRGGLLYLDELGQARPRAPSIVCATRNDDDTLTLRWQPAQNALGVQIELELADGTFRPIAVAAGGATTARVPLLGLAGDAARIRTWNAAGLSAPSSIAPSLPPPFATLRSSMRACAGAPATIAVTLAGMPPFTVHWADGHVQTNVRSNNTTRTVTVARDTTFTIVSVADASCEAGQVAESIRVSVDLQPAIRDQTRDVRIGSGETATLSVVASDATSYAWFEGARGDTSRPAGSNTATFTTPALTRSAQYWVRVTNRCGSVDSQTMSVAVNVKRRTVRR